MECIIGKGSYSTVYSCCNNRAVKKCQDVYFSQRDALQTLREVAILSAVEHDNVIKLHEVYSEGSQTICLVTDLCEQDLA